MTMMTMTPKEVRKGMIECFEAGLAPFVTSSPGLGKSALVRQLAKEFKLELIDIRLSQCAPEDLMGLPMRKGEGDQMRSAFAPFEMFPIEGDEIPAGKNGWLLFLDEANSATKMVQAAAYRLVLDREVGQSKLHENVFVALAGNLSTDRAIVTSLSTAMQSRLIHMEMEISLEDFMDHAVKAKYDPRVLAFLEFQPGKLHDFKPDHTDRTFPCPRTWEFVSRLIQGKGTNQISQKLLGGTIGEGTAVEFCNYIKVFDQLPSFSKILSDPENETLPTDAGMLYATIMSLLDKFDRKNFPEIGKYVKRMDPEFQIVFFRGVVRRDPKMKKDKDFTDLRKDLVNFLHGDDDMQAAA